MPRDRQQDIKTHTNFYLNKVEIRTDYYGDYIKSNLKEIKRRYELIYKATNKHIKRRDLIKKQIANIEGNERSLYNRLLRKPHKTTEELHDLSRMISTLEELYNKLYPLERELRDSLRTLRAVFPSETMEVVYNELGEEMKGAIK